MTSLIDVVRVNHSVWSWGSVRFEVDGNPTEGLLGLDFEEQLEMRTIPSNAQDAPPLGISRGAYRIGRFPLRMLRDSARSFKRYLDTKAKTSGLSSFGHAIFQAGLALAGTDAGDLVPSATSFVDCRIVGEKNVHVEGIDELVTEFAVGCIAIVQDDTTLWNALALPFGGFPSVDTITLAGVVAPGKWTLRSGSKKYGWDVRKGTALSGATVVPTGDDLVHPAFLVEFWDPVDYVAFLPFRSTYLKKPLIGVPGAPTSLAIGIDHPELKELGVESVVVEEINPVTNDGFGVWSTEVKFLQYRRPLPALSRPNAEIPSPDAPPPANWDAKQQKIFAQGNLIKVLAP